MAAAQKSQDGDLAFPGNMNSFMHPDLLVPGTYARGMNVVSRGGILQCRPGYRCKFVLPQGKCQGGAIFRPRVGSPVILFAVNGLLYVSDSPFTTYRQVTGVEFSPTADRLFFCQVEDSIQENLDGSLTFVDKRNLMVIQDGGYARPVVYDGTTAGHTSQIPLGGPMAWVGNRLWVAQDTSLFPSNLADPLSFTEYRFVAGASRHYTLPGPITALAKVPSTASAQLAVFTHSTTTIFQAGISSRAQWNATPDFQKEVFPEVGCVANRSVVSHWGLLYWYSLSGVTSMDSAAQANLSSALPYRDAEMTDSKSALSSDLTGIACSTFENYLLVSVPHADTYNSHTWVADRSPFLSVETQNPWNSFWTGTRPIEWLSGLIDGENRSLFLSADYDGENRLWEAFTPDRRDSGCPVTWWVETRGCNFRAPTDKKEFRYADLYLSELSGRVDLGVFWAGSLRGKYKRILSKRINASRGTFCPENEITRDSEIFGLKKQSRTLRTQDAKALYEKETLKSCGVESSQSDLLDEAFQLLIVGSGPGALRGYIMYADPQTLNEDGNRSLERDETEDNFVRFDGAAAEDDVEEFDASTPIFRSAQTQTVSKDGFSAIATGYASSVISQSNADHIAATIATRKAYAELERALPPIVSIGEAANEIE